MEAYGRTGEVETLLGDPKKAVLAMAIPTAVALAAQAINTLVDTIWVAGLGRDALAAVGIVFPIFFIIIGISNGIGIGAMSAISKRIGACNKPEADRTVAHAMVLVLISSIAMTALLILFLEPMLRIMGTGASEGTIQECINYAFPMVLFTVVFITVGVMSSILRAEGAAKRSMYVLIMAASINLILDPLLIYDYGLGWGMSGAAIATVLAEASAMVVMFYWYLIKKDLFLKFIFKKFKFEWAIIKDILKVGIPASTQIMILSISTIFMNLIILQAGGDDGVAMFSTGWRVINLLIIPMMGISIGMIPVCAAAFGAKRYDKIQIAYKYSLKISVLSMMAISCLTIIFAPQILTIFTYDSSIEYLREGMVSFLRIACLFLPFMALGMAAESLFQAVGMGLRSLTSTVFRNFIMLPVCYIAMIMTSDLLFIWWGTTASEIIASTLVLIWSFIILRSIMRDFDEEKVISCEVP